jgi:hypothetical protein
MKGNPIALTTDEMAEILTRAIGGTAFRLCLESTA